MCVQSKSDFINKIIKYKALINKSPRGRGLGIPFRIESTENKLILITCVIYPLNSVRTNLSFLLGATEVRA